MRSLKGPADLAGLHSLVRAFQFFVFDHACTLLACSLSYTLRLPRQLSCSGYLQEVPPFMCAAPRCMPSILLPLAGVS